MDHTNLIHFHLVICYSACDFQSLVGEQYGAACLPEQVELSEFLTVLQVCQEMGISSEVLEKCYRRDENTIPPSFCLIDQHEHKYKYQVKALISIVNGEDFTSFLN